MSGRWPVWRAPVSRRTLGKQLAGVFFAAVAARTGVQRTLFVDATGTGSWRVSPQSAPVLSFFLDQPYLDPSGVGVPYLPPRGLRGGERLAGLSERELRHIAPYGPA